MKNIKIILVAGMALFLTLAVLGNLLMADAASGAVKVAVGMETTFKHPAVMWRAVTNPMWVYALFGVIVLAEAASAVVCVGVGEGWAGRHRGGVLHRLAGDCQRMV